MKTNLKLNPAAGVRAALFCLWLSGCAEAQQPKAAPPAVPTAEEALLVSTTARVEAIDLAKREVTLKGPLGNTVTFVVDERVNRLDEVKVGDEIAADYYVSLAAEVRAATPEEKLNPLTILEEKAKAPRGTSPAGGGLRMIKAVTTVEGLDRPTRSLTIKGPLGNYHTIRARDVHKLERLRLGDTIMVTYTEALAVSLKKVPIKSEEKAGNP